MTTRSQKRKAVAELASGDFETPVVENNSNENLIAGPSKNPRKETENLEEIKTSLRNEIMTDLTKIPAENQKEIFKLIALLSKKRSISANIQESDSEPEDVPVARTSTPVKTNTATGSKTTPVNSRNMVTGVGFEPTHTFVYQKQMLFLPVEINTVKIDALVDSGAYMNAFSERDADKLRKHASQCIVNKAPPPPFKVQYANAELEQPLATYTLRFKIGDYTFEETFIIMNQTSFPIIGLAFLSKHAAILDTAQGTIDFPKIQITMALTDERQKCNPKPITIKTEAKHTIPAHSTRIIYATMPVSIEHSITGTVQPLPQFDECAKVIVALAITTARDK